MFLRLFAVTKGARGSLLAKALLGILITGTYVAQALLLAKGVRYVFAGQRWENFIPIAAWILMLVMARALLLWSREIYGKRAAAKVKEALRINLFYHLFNLGPGYMEEGRTGKIQSVFIDGVEALEVFLVNYIPQIIVTATGLLCIIAYMVKLDAVIGCIVTVAVLVCILSPMFWDKLMNKIGHGHWESYGDLNAQFLDSMQGITTLKAFNASEEKGRELERNADVLYQNTMKKLNVSLTSSAIVGFASSAGTALAIGIGALRASMGILPFAGLSVILFLSTECFRPITELNMFWHQSFLGLSAAEKMYEFLDAEITVGDRGRKELTYGAGNLPSITFSDVSFAYSNGERPAVKNISITIDAGSTASLVGQSGAGKSTIVNLLLRFFDPQKGQIQIDGVNIEDISLKDLRAMIAAVFQETYLFYGTVEENIRVAKPGAALEEVVGCCKLANIHELIEGLPDGYQTMVGERGIRFSGGERQRISIARAILKDAPILILDEATSSVDASNEKLIQKGLEHLMKNRTTLVIAHRLSTIMNSDEIFVMADGKIAEHGAAQELIDQQGAFAELVRAQQAGEGVEKGEESESLFKIDTVS
jgi:ATP-binding cassette subfamily B protein